MEYIDTSKFFITYEPRIEVKDKDEQIDFNTGYYQPIPTYDFSDLFKATDPISVATSKTFDDLFGPSEKTKIEKEELEQTYTGPISNNLDLAINHLLNKPYQLGGGHNNNPNAKSLDCSGFVTLCFKEAYGIDLNGSARDIYNNKLLTSVTKALPGDIIFFRGTTDKSRANGNYVSHVGIITKVDDNGNPIEMAHASARQYKKTVKVPYTDYWKKYKPEIKRLKT